MLHGVGGMNAQGAEERRIEIAAADWAQHVVHGAEQNVVDDPTGLVDVVKLAHGEANQPIGVSDGAEAPVIFCGGHRDMSFWVNGLEAARIRGQKSRRAVNDMTTLTHAPNTTRMNSAFALLLTKGGRSMDFRALSAYMKIIDPRRVTL